MVTEALQAACRCGACGLVILRADSAFYTRALVTAAHEAGARFSVTAPLYPSVTRAIAAIADTAWTPIRYPQAIFDAAEQRLITDAEAAEVSFAAFRATGTGSVTR